jgi:hypothetical protein
MALPIACSAGLLLGNDEQQEGGMEEPNPQDKTLASRPLDETSHDTKPALASTTSDVVKPSVEKETDSAAPCKADTVCPPVVPGSRAARKRPLDGSDAEILVDTTGTVAYELGATVASALMGCVRAAKPCVRAAATAAWTPLAEDDAQPLVVKQLEKGCIAAGRTLTGLRVREDPKQEIALLRLVAAENPGHPNVVRLVDVLEDHEHIYVVLAACTGGELLEAAMDTSDTSEAKARQLAWQLLQGVRFLHGLGFCHRDLSLENAMLTSNNILKIIDMGLSAPLSPTGMVPHDGRVGKQRYCAPEVHAGLVPEYDGRSADAWQVGVCIFALLFRRYLWEAATPINPYIRHLSRGGTLRDLFVAWSWDKSVSPEALSLLDGLLRVDPKSRLGLEAAAGHEWFAPCRNAECAAAGAASADCAIGPATALAAASVPTAIDLSGL